MQGGRLKIILEQGGKKGLREFQMRRQLFPAFNKFLDALVSVIRLIARNKNGHWGKTRWAVEKATTRYLSQQISRIQNAIIPIRYPRVLLFPLHRSETDSVP